VPYDANNQEVAEEEEEEAEEEEEVEEEPRFHLTSMLPNNPRNKRKMSK